MPVVGIDAMNKHLAEITKCVSVSAIALLILDGAGWHSSPQLIVPENIALMPLPPYAPELNSVENIWAYLRSNFLSHCVWDTYEAILRLVAMPGTPSWPNPRSSPQLEPEIGHRSKLRAVGINRFASLSFRRNSSVVLRLEFHKSSAGMSHKKFARARSSPIYDSVKVRLTGFLDDAAHRNGMMPPGSRASLADSFFVIGDDSWSSFLILFDAGSAQALAGEIDPVRIMDEAIKNRVGVGGIAYDFVPALHGKLRGDDGRTGGRIVPRGFRGCRDGRRRERLQSQSSRMSRSARPSERRMRGWRPSPRARVRSSKSLGTR
jgi:DDE superfamily endonuclease